MRAFTMTALALSTTLLGSGVATARKVTLPPPPPKPAVNPAFATSTVADWNVVPPATTEPTFKPPVAKRLKLKNGIAVLVIENHALPIVSMNLVVAGAGSSRDPAGKGGLAVLAADMLDEGAGGLTSLAIANETDRLGAGIVVGANVDTASMSIQTLAKTLDQTVELATKIVTQPTFDPKELARVQGDVATELELRRDRPREVAQLMLDAALYGATTPYGHPSGGTRDEMKALTLADVTAFYTQHWTPAAMTLVVVGDVSTAALKAKLDATLGAWKPEGGVAPSRLVVKPAKPGKRLLLVDRSGAAQSDVRIGLLGMPRKDRRYFQLEVLATALGGSFTSRLNHRLREELGITYGIGSAARYRVASSAFQINTAIVTAETAHGLAEIFQIVDGLATAAIPPAELTKAKENNIRALPAMFETNASTAGTIAELAVAGLPDNFYATYASNVRKVTAADVKALAKTMIPSGRMQISIVGDMSVVRPELEKLKLGAVQMHDLYGVPIK